MLLENSWETLCPIPRWSSDLRTAFELVYSRIQYQLTTDLDDVAKYLLLDLTHLTAQSGLSVKPDLLLPYGIPDTRLGQDEYSWRAYAQTEGLHPDPTTMWMANNLMGKELSHRDLVALGSRLSPPTRCTLSIHPEASFLAPIRFFAQQDYRRGFFVDPTEKGYRDYELTLSHLHTSTSGTKLHSIPRLYELALSVISNECLSEHDPITRLNRCTSLSFVLILVLYYHRLIALNPPSSETITSRLRDFITFLTKDAPYVQQPPI